MSQGYTNASFIASTTIRPSTNPVTGSAYAILDLDGYARIECDTTANAITITLPLIANNSGRRIEIALVKNDSSLDVVTVKCHATDGSKLSNDSLAELYLTRVGDYLIVQHSPTSGLWEIVHEKLTAQLRLDTYAGHGSTNTDIMRWTNVIENYGTTGSSTADKGCFQENHTTGYHITDESGSANAGGLEITINRTGRYAFTFNGEAGTVFWGMSLNATGSLSTPIYSITSAMRLAMCGTGTAGFELTVTYIGWFKKNDIVRSHSSGAAFDNPARSSFTVSYLG